MQLDYMKRQTDIQSVKMKSNLVKIKEVKLAKFKNIEMFILEEAKKLILETKTKYEEAYHQLESEGLEYIGEMDRLNEEITICSKLEVGEKIGLLQQGNMKL